MRLIIKKNQQGFVALMSVIIISAVLLVMMVSAAGIAFRGRFSVLDYENKKIGVGLAEACAQVAMLKIAQNSQYGGGEDVVVEGDKKCRICSVAGNNPYIISARAAYRGTHTNLEVRAFPNGNNFNIDSWQEKANVENPDACPAP